MLKKTVSLFMFLYGLSFAQMIGPQLAIQQLEYNFGDIKAGKIVTHKFILTNSGGDLLKILNVSASCGCTAAKPDKSELAPGESTRLVVEFNSKGRQGRQDKYITVKTNDPKQPEVRLKIYGNVINDTGVKNDLENPRIYFPATQYDFGKVKEGKIADYTFSFQNKGKTTLEIKDIKTSCGCTAAVVSSKTIAPGKKGTIKVELDTKNREGKFKKTITVFSNDPNEPQKILTVSADIIKAKH